MPAKRRLQVGKHMIRSRFKTLSKGNVRDENTQAYDGLAQATSLAAFIGGVVGSLSGKGRKPKDGEHGVHREHGVWLSEAASSFKPGRHDEVDPSRSRQEALMDA